MLPDPKYNPSNSGGITSGTKLGPGITMAKFLGARGSRTNLEKHDEVFSDRLQLANMPKQCRQFIIISNSRNIV
jgi:hypothetical protein